jgi:site-specific DNA-methyltransferase (cytosine-N4-specific)
MTVELIHGDCLAVMPNMKEDSVDLVFGSPPYVDARTYGIDFKLKGQDWVDWMVERVLASLRICKGLVAFVVEGKTKQFRWDATPALLMADLHRAGVCLRKPPAFHRIGVPGSGGPDWLRNDYEFIVCCQKEPKRLSWSDNTALGKKCKHATGGRLSNRNKDGIRANVSGGYYSNGAVAINHQRQARPKIANPGNIVKCNVGGGHMGSKLAHENEAPFPEELARFFICSFCPPAGVVLDPFVGSGTTIAAALKEGRNSIGIDIRESQIELSKQRKEEVGLFEGLNPVNPGGT